MSDPITIADVGTTLAQLGGPADDFISGDWFKVLFEGGLYNAWTAGGFGLLAGGITTMAILSWSRSFGYTAVWAALVAGVMLPALPSQAAFVAYIFLAVALALALYQLVK